MDSKTFSVRITRDMSRSDVDKKLASLKRQIEEWQTEWKIPHASDGNIYLGLMEHDGHAYWFERFVKATSDEKAKKLLTKRGNIIYSLPAVQDEAMEAYKIQEDVEETEKEHRQVFTKEYEEIDEYEKKYG
ncbi:MAG: hypothetical protein ACXACI_02790 [Candidatus Hodarchaeales archaeon]